MSIIYKSLEISERMFRKLSNYLSGHPVQKHFFFLAVAILASFINGYHFGTFDQVFHITFLKKFINPNLYPSDPFLTLRWYHFSYFWFPFIPLLKAGILEVSMFVTHVITVYGTVWMFWSLSDFLFEDSRSNLLISLALLFPHLGFPGFQIIEFSLLNRTFTLPFLLGSILLYLQGRKGWAFLLLGLMFNLHVIYAIFVLCMFLLNEAITFDEKSWWKPLTYLGLFTLAGLPVLIWRMQTGTGIDLTLRPEMLELAADGLLYSVYYPIGTSSVVIGNFLFGIGTLWGFILGYKHSSKSTKHETMRNFVVAIGILLLIGTITSYLLPITILVQMQILRAGVFLLYFGMLYLSYFLCQKQNDAQLPKGSFVVLFTGFIILITPLLTILLWGFINKVRKIKLSPLWLGSLVIAIQVFAAFIALQSNLWAPGFFINGPESSWREVQEWAKANTSVNAMFITPPHLFGHYTPDWRVFSERSSVATIPEMMEIPFDPDFAVSFQNRFAAIAPGAIESFNGNYIRSLEIAEWAFYSNSASDFKRITCEFSADFLVTEQGHPYPFDLVHENNGFLVYRLPNCE